MLIDSIKNCIEETYFQKEIVKIYDLPKINKIINTTKIISWTLLAFFVLSGIILLCFIQLIKIKNADLIFGLSGGSSILIGIFCVFISPIYNFNMLSRIFRKHYDFSLQNQYLAYAFRNVQNPKINKIKTINKNLEIHVTYNEKEYTLKFMNQQVKLFNLDNKLINSKNITHNLNQLIKIYQRDIDKNTFADINSFTYCVEIKIKKLAKLIIGDFINLLQNDKE